MIFGEFSLDVAEGLVLAHSIRLADGKLPKGHHLTAGDVEALRAGGVTRVIACRIEDDDLGEDLAAEALANAMAPDHLRFSPASTGRVNIHAACNGLFVADREVVDRFNRVDPAITFACLDDHSDVRTGDLVATVKIIPLAVSRRSVDMALDIFRQSAPVTLKPYSAHEVSLIATELPSLKTSVMDKTARVLEQRLSPSGSRLVGEQRVPHHARDVAAAIEAALVVRHEEPPMVVIFGASAMTDPADVIPEAIRMAGGIVEQVGLPVDPGNLLVLGRVGDVPVIGAPGCARSPKENGFDWVMNRLLAGEHPTALELSGLGVGGLLMEIPSRPLPREVATHGDKILSISIVLLAAGKASRMGGSGNHKLLAEFDGEPLVRRSARISLESGACPVVVVTGHRAADIRDALAGLAVGIVDNPDFASGMASSLKTGFEVPQVAESDGVLVMLADMPGLVADDLKRLIDAFHEHGGTAIVRAVANGKRGNPVILPRSTFDAVKALEGDIGARPIVEGSGLPVIDVEIGAAAHLDVDTPEAVVSAGGILKG
ncbi:molybdopterin-binding/glycosyltransferase family 2 protein [Ciceribacter sp. L1K23]|uniref:NTP transferase domain-containing protein n=1 Tax=Ciceribacter sp. L1K23 TaxID=2820276 RepID=UPI001B823EA8|nr:molybdopterin-binding/glycosyltransferase family 2 protein [Ciceribacter sp. L1K23]MBR0555336.1 molybdopterin-binding/glycosyltransferase family 2 protein [Ciceribacter sp. L1K23]